MDDVSKTFRHGSCVAALGATVVLHGLVLGWAVRNSGESRALPLPNPLRIELLAGIASETMRDARPDSLTGRPAASSRIRRSATVPVANVAPRNTQPAKQGRDGPGEPVAALGDDFAPPDPVLGSTSAAEAEPEPDASPTTTAAGDPQTGGTAPAPAEPLSTEGRWRYDVYYGDYPANDRVATLDYVLQIGDGRYRLSTEGQARGLLSLFYRGFFRQSSEGGFGSNGFTPLRYEERRGERQVRVVRVEDSRTALFDDGRSEPVSSSVQDRLSLAGQLAWLAATRSALLHEPRLQMQLIGASSVRSLQFDLTRDLILETPAGPRQLVRLRSEDGDGGQPGSLEVWLSESGGLMPFRIRIEDRAGQVLDQVLVVD